MRTILVLGLIVALSIWAQGCQQPQEAAEEQVAATRPNILLIVADDLGYSDIGFFGGEIATPTLDTLAREGLMLTNFHVLPSCSPTRSVLLSGVDNHQAGLGSMGEFHTPEMDGYPGYIGYLNFEVAALPELMKADGYRTYMVGKWHLGFEEETSPHARGFDETFILVPGGGSHWSDRMPLSPPQPMIYRRNGKEVESLPEDFYSTRYYTDRLLEWIRRDHGDGKPFFAYLSYTAPHDPLHAPKEYIDRYEGVFDEGWDVLRFKRLHALKELGIIHPDAEPFPRLSSVKAWDEMSTGEKQTAARGMEVYAAMVDYLDEQIKRVFDSLKEIGEYDNTMILFFSDNGANGAKWQTAYPGQTEEFVSSFDNSLDNRGLPGSFIDTGPGWAQASSSPSRMFKGFPAEGGIRSPFVVKLPGATVNAGTMSHAFVHVRDIMPTILDLAGVAHAEEFGGRAVLPLQGRSVLGLLAGQAEVPYPEASRVGYELFGLKAYFDGDWKILWMPPPFGSGEWELYNLEDDPAEMNNLGVRHPERLEQMVAMWEQYKTDNEVLDISFDLAEKVQ